MLDIRPDLLETVKSILSQHIPGCEVRAFGSRVNATAKDSSDLDLVIVGKGKIDWKVMGSLRAAFEESSLPFRVDCLDWNAIPENFRGNIEKGYEILQEAIKE